MSRISSPDTFPNRRYIVYIGGEQDSLIQDLRNEGFDCLYFKDPFIAYVNSLSDVYAKKPNPYAFICREDLPQQEAYKFISNLQKCPQFCTVPAILVNPGNTNANKRAAKLAGADDLYHGSFEIEDFLDRLSFLNQTKEKNREEQEFNTKSHPNLRLSLGKRAFDIMFSFLALLVLAPIMLLVAIAIKLESKGPVFYISKRVGTGYRIFNFYKFRSMRSDADKMVKELMHLNQYNSGEGTTFFKLDNDPRTTRVGRFLRNTSLDEIPQLINVLIGDMSIVGNRPLPLYEAQMITKDLWSKRFLAPAGITGLWQVTKRGKKEMSAEERIALDMTYADRCSLWYDMKIVAQTFPALLQKGSV